MEKKRKINVFASRTSIFMDCYRSN